MIKSVNCEKIVSQNIEIGIGTKMFVFQIRFRILHFDVIQIRNLYDINFFAIFRNDFTIFGII